MSMPNHWEATSHSLCVLHNSGYKYHVRGEETFERKARTRYLVRPFELTEHDAHQCRSNSSYRPTPKLGITQVFEFFLGEGRKIK